MRPMRSGRNRRTGAGSPWAWMPAKKRFDAGDRNVVVDADEAQPAEKEGDTQARARQTPHPRVARWGVLGRVPGSPVATGSAATGAASCRTKPYDSPLKSSGVTWSRNSLKR